MERQRFFIAICGGLLALLFLHHPISAEIANRVVAFVNNDIITLHELNKEIQRTTGLSPEILKRRNEKAYFETGRKVLNSLIDEKIYRDKIKELKIKVTDAELDAALKKIEQDNRITHEELLETLEKQGITYDSYREDIKNRIEKVRLIGYEVKSKIIIREEDILKYYNQNKNDFETEEKVRLAAIFLIQKNPGNNAETVSLERKSNEILSRLKDGEIFAELAKEYSQGPAAKEGGDLGYFKTSQLDPKLTEIVKDMSPGDVSDPITTPTGIKIIKVLEKQQKGVKTLEEARDAIQGELYLKEVNRRYASWIKELRENAYIKIDF